MSDPLTSVERATVSAFGALYSGGHAQRLRDAGDVGAMPPWTEVTWLGKQVVKSPIDLWLYQELLVARKPELLIETGTSGSGSAFYFASLFDLLGTGHVLTIDKDRYPHLEVVHPRITYLIGDSISPAIIAAVHARAAGCRTMLVLDSLHTAAHVAAELHAYAPLVSQGEYCVVEDVFYPPDSSGGDPAWGSTAVVDLLAASALWRRDLRYERHFFTSNIWLQRQ